MKRQFILKELAAQESCQPFFIWKRSLKAFRKSAFSDNNIKATHTYSDLTLKIFIFWQEFEVWCFNQASNLTFVELK